MKNGVAFWDSSALAPLCIHEATSRRAQSHLRQFGLAVWWGSLVEVQSAICSSLRESRISEASKQAALSRLLALSRVWKEVAPDEELRELAMALLEEHSLRVGDSLQLAASLVWCQQRPSKRTFICTDRKLAEAAGKTGFSVVGF